ncbi:Hypothetical predicted protein [Cloeon dipterum]|uniref:Metaxin-2 n=1 Tax=Cloeon dipterum TaxID=197152 RepID=A0A8S1DB03_9INSE|nr:Hypothetical predicted protein [Cloeon dipterum]
MPSVLLGNVAANEMAQEEEWANDTKLYMPYDVEQILLADNANCVAVQTFLRMCNLPYRVEYRKNAEFMSPSGRVPFIQCGKYLIPELDHIVTFVNNKGKSLTGHLNDKQKSDMRADLSLINNVLVNAELYLTWVEPVTLKEVTIPRYSSVYPWPLGTVLSYSKRSEVIARLKALQWYDKSIEEVYNEVDKVCSNLSTRLEKNQYFFGKPTELDALVFGHLHTIYTTKLPYTALWDTVKSYHNLIAHTDRINSLYFSKKG